MEKCFIGGPEALTVCYGPQIGLYTPPGQADRASGNEPGVESPAATRLGFRPWACLDSNQGPLPYQRSVTVFWGFPEFTNILQMTVFLD